MSKTKITYLYDGIGPIDESYEDKIRLTGLNLGKDEDVGYIYILNINGSDVCKIGTTTRIFERISAIRQIVKSVFPFIENSITYNVYISKPITQRFKLEKELHKIFYSYNIDGEWFKCSYDKAIETLQEHQKGHVSDVGMNHVFSMIDDKKYKHYLLDKEFDRIKYLKCISCLDFEAYLTEKYPFLFCPNNFSLSDNSTPHNVCAALEDYNIHIQSITLNDTDLSDTKKLYAYKLNAKKQLLNLIQKIKGGDFDAD